VRHERSHGFHPVPHHPPDDGGLTRIERARGFLEAARLSEDWLRRCAPVPLCWSTSHHHIEGTRLTLEQAERLLAGE
jgi:hypothetical protein